MNWISVKDKLPKNGKTVLIAWKNFRKEKFIDIGEFYKNSDNQWHFVYCDVDGTKGLNESQVTHWMLLPKLPTE